MRDDFNVKTKEELAKRVGYLCSNPKCRIHTIGAQDGQDGTINIGEAAHICAASVGGKRYDVNMTPEQRADISNGIWLCRNCAAMIDRDEDYFTKEILYLWKDLAEKEANQLILLGKTFKDLRSLCNKDSEIMTVVKDTMEMNNTMYILKEHDFHGDFQRSYLDPLFDLLDYFAKPSNSLQNSELRNVTDQMIMLINQLRAMIGWNGGPARFGNGSYVIDREEDQRECNDICDKIWNAYETVAVIRNKFD